MIIVIISTCSNINCLNNQVDICTRVTTTSTVVKNLLHLLSESCRVRLLCCEESDTNDWCCKHGNTFHPSPRNTTRNKHYTPNYTVLFNGHIGHWRNEKKNSISVKLLFIIVRWRFNAKQWQLDSWPSLMSPTSVCDNLITISRVIIV